MSEYIESHTGITKQPLSPKTIFLPVSRMITRRWILTTAIVFIFMGGMIRLGIWQLDRLDQRRAFNDRVFTQLNQPTLELQDDALNLELEKMEYRSIVVRGFYDHSNEVGLRNQAHDNQWGVHLLTPLQINDSNLVILVDRGWVPTDDFSSTDWDQYNESGIVEVNGIIRASQDKPDFGRRRDSIPAPGEEPLKLWYFANVEGIDNQVPYDLLPVYVQQGSDASLVGLPIRTQPELDLTEGPHMGYAIQWFTFATIALLGYLLFIYKREINIKNSESHVEES